MVEYMGHFVERATEWTKARQSPSRLLPNALDQVDAAIWLIAGRRYSQAITVLHTAIELLLKSELEKFHPLLIADRIDYRRLRYLLKDELQKHPQFQSIAAEPVDSDKTITFSEALERLKDLHPELQTWWGGLQELQKIRNKIVHRHDDGDINDYVRLICTVALPFLEMFVSVFVQIDLEKLLGRDVYREIGVARHLCEELKRSGQPTYTHALNTVRTVMLYRDVEFPAPVDKDGWQVDDSDREFQTAESLKRDLYSRWNGELMAINCKICGSIYAYAGIDEFDEEHPLDMAPHSLACARCGLWIDRHDIGLAKMHFGIISAALIEKSLDEDL